MDTGLARYLIYQCEHERQENSVGSKRDKVEKGQRERERVKESEKEKQREREPRGWVVVLEGEGVRDESGWNVGVGKGEVGVVAE